MFHVTRSIPKHTRGFNCQVIRQFDGLTRICGWKQRKPRPTTISVIGLLVSPHRCFTPALMFARESWYSLFPGCRVSDNLPPNLLINFQLQFGSGSVILPPILSILKLLFLFFFFIHRSISNDNYSMHDYCNEIIISHVWIYLFEDIIFKENYYFHRYRKCCE